MSVTPEEFVRAWQSSESTDEVAKKTGRKASACQVRASAYRKRGIKLKYFSTGRVDVDALNKIIKVME